MDKVRIYAFFGVLAFLGLMFLYALEFQVFSNTVGMKSLAMIAILLGLSISGGLCFRYRERYTPWSKHFPEVAFIVVLSTFFAPLLLSLLNRSLGKKGTMEAKFVAEKPFFATGYGVLKGEDIEVTGYRLHVTANGSPYSFKYKKQAYFPITKPGEAVLLPVVEGVLGWKVVALK